MARCKLCNNKGLFLKVDKDGYCADCAKLRQDNIKKREEAKKARIEEEKKNILEIPEFKIELTNEKRNRNIGFEAPKYSNITPKGKYSEFVVFDTETTGLTPSKDRIIELAAIKVKDGVAISKFHTYVNPERHIPREATDINHITDEIVATAPKISEVLTSFEEFIGKDILVAHNLEFDLKFLFYAGSNILDTKRKYIDTLSQSRKMFKKSAYGCNSIISNEVANHKLDNLCAFLDIPMADKHSALSDSFATARLFLMLVNMKQS